MEEDSPLFHSLQISSGRPNMAEQEDEVPLLAVGIGARQRGRSPMAINQLSESRLCHSSVGFVAVALVTLASPAMIDSYAARRQAAWSFKWTTI